MPLASADAAPSPIAPVAHAVVPDVPREPRPGGPADATSPAERGVARANASPKVPMRSSWIVAGLVLLVATGGFVAAHARPVAKQPIRFSHKAHVAAGVDCDGCHATATEQAFAGMPTLETCTDCHDQPLTKDPEEKKLKAYQAANTDPAWVRIYTEPAHVFFSHRRHVQLGKVPCATCHGPMQQLTEPPLTPAVKQSMTWCMECHRQRHASIDCIACHR